MGSIYFKGVKVIAGLVMRNPGKTSLSTPESPKEAPISEKPEVPSQAVSPALPTSAETTAMMKRRLAKELYKAELDLSQGLKIVGKPCDCLSEKHTLELEAAAEELIASEPENPVYQNILSWISENQNKVTRPAIASGQYAQEYPKMASQFRDFRKRVMGSVGTGEATERVREIISLEKAKLLAAEEAANEVERQWHNQK